MRGKQYLANPVQAVARITPAYAGKTPGEYTAVSSITDHPRVCGENDHKRTVYDVLHGSPPRMRGKPPEACTAEIGTRITPAYAGKTCFATACACVRADHPRVCGENAGKVNLSHVVDGSPPRMRGKHSLLH